MYPRPEHGCFLSHLCRKHITPRNRSRSLVATDTSVDSIKPMLMCVISNLKFETYFRIEFKSWSFTLWGRDP